MAYVNPINTYIGDDLWIGFKFKYEEALDKEKFIKKLFTRYKAWIALSKVK
jgi:hypothetical protein